MGPLSGIWEARQRGAQVAARGVGVAGMVAWPAAVQGVDPGRHIAGDARGQFSEFGVQPGLEGGDAVVVEQLGLGEDLGDSADADPVAVQHADQLGVPKALPLGVPGGQDDQRPIQLGDELAVAAVRLSQPPCDPTQSGQQRIGQLGVQPPVERSPGSGQLQLQLASVGGPRLGPVTGSPGGLARRVPERGPRILVMPANASW